MKKTIRKSAQKKLKAQTTAIQTRNWARNLIGKINTANQRGAEWHEKQAFLRSLTNNQMTRLQRYLNGESIDRVSVKALRVYHEQLEARRAA